LSSDTGEAFASIPPNAQDQRRVYPEAEFINL